MKMQTLHCKAGHDWERASQRGKPPVWCSEHRPEKPERDIKTTSGGSIVLTCSNCKKDWERPPKRGRKPSLCPDCQPVKAPRGFSNKRRGVSVQDDDSSPTIPKNNNKDIVVSESVLIDTKRSYPDCKCEDLGLRINMTWGELVKLGAGCTDGRLRNGGGGGWVCPRLVIIRNRYY